MRSAQMDAGIFARETSNLLVKPLAVPVIDRCIKPVRIALQDREITHRETARLAGFAENLPKRSHATALRACRLADHRLLFVISRPPEECGAPRASNGIDTLEPNKNHQRGPPQPTKPEDTALWL